MAMDNIILITLLLLGIYTSVSEGQTCDWITSHNEDCLSEFSCSEEEVGGIIQLNIWEDCAEGSILFTQDGTKVFDEKQCPAIFNYNGTTVTLSNSLDVDGEDNPEVEPSSVTCFPIAGYFTPVKTLDVDEYTPTTKIPQTYIVDNFKETEDTGIELLRFGVLDNDFGETESITMIDDLSADNDNEYFIFEAIIENDIRVFIITNSKSIDFEKQQVYYLNYNISSTDGRRNSSGFVQQQVMVFVQDVSDMPPIWVQPVPAITLPECPSGTLAFTVKAQDRDVTIGNAITYNITDGNDEGFFKIDENSGEVTTIKKIDREEDTISFVLKIEAKEVSEVAPANGKDSSSQVTNIYISDINDNSPTFDKKNYTYEMEELSDITGQDMELHSLIIFVADMDEGNNGTYTVITSNLSPLDTSQLEVVAPSTTGRNSSITLRAKAGMGNFDYETQEEGTPLEFTLTATEVADGTHISTATLIITLRDINDNIPVFDTDYYAASINESVPEGYSVLTVAATDNDRNDTFGNLSIRYFLLGCPELNIDEVSGEVTVSSTGFQFEEKQKVECTVQAKDFEGEPGCQVNDVKIVITVNDVPDGVPALELSNKISEIQENKTDSEVLCNLTATDNDASAAIVFMIDWVNSVPNNKEEIKEWFEIPAATKDGHSFTSEVRALPSKVDREVVDKITLRIVANDTASGNVNNNDQDLIFTITDINDCWPEFSSNFASEFNIKEYNGEKGCQDGDVIAFIDASDTDENPIISFEIRLNSSESDYVEVNATGYLLVKNASLINREKESQFSVDIIIKDQDNHNNTQTVTIDVRDLNDNKPIFDMSICEKQYTIPEDAGNGTVIATVIATDMDEGPHKIPYYRLLTIEQNYQTPFTIDSDSGTITVFQNIERVLDREKSSFWNLLITALDKCGDYTSDPTCTVLESDQRCMINVTVTDVNDESPSNFKIYKGVENVQTITVSESVKAESDLGYEILAFDDDEPNTDNSKINYEVKGVYLNDELFTNISFEAINKKRINTQTDNMEYYCSLKSTEDLTHQRGIYTIIIEATDGGEPPNQTNETLNVEVTDANDYLPQFDFSISPCPDNSFIKMEENNIAGDFLTCSTGSTEKFKFQITDKDLYLDRAVRVEILENSTFSDGATQLKAFKIVEIEPKVFEIKVTEKINRDTQGSWYNLTIYAQDCKNCDNNEPKLEQIHYLRINITNVFEYEPIFNGSDGCNSNVTKCVQAVYIPENESYDEAFMEAYDEDNINGDETEPVYYRIVYVQPKDGKITLKKNENAETPAITAESLDREEDGNYTVIIDTYNNEPYTAPIPYSDPQTNRLFLSVIVLDKYDMAPVFDNNKNVSFGSFMPTDNSEDVLLTIEALDVDLNETLTYDISGNFTWTGSEAPSGDQPPFKFEQNTAADPRSANLLLNFNPKGQSGFCTFPITVTDKGNLTSVTEVKIFSIIEDLQVPFFFQNTIADLQTKQYDLQASLTLVFGYACKIDNIEQPSGQVTREESEVNNIVTTHFIDEAQNEVVKNNVIERMANGDKAADLLKTMNALELSLTGLGESNIETPADNSQLYMVLLALAVGVLLLVLVLLGFAYHRSTTNLRRQVKALSANTFGSMSSEIDKIGVDSAPVPGSNQFSGEGTNPMYNLKEITTREDDTSSVGSGDSVLVGVEDTEDFRNYGRGKTHAPQPSGKRTAPAAPHEEGRDNLAFTGRSIDQVSSSAPPAAFDNATRTNPLMQLGEEKDLTDALADYQFNVARRSSSDMEDNDTGASALNSNFSFG